MHPTWSLSRTKFQKRNNKPDIPAPRTLLVHTPTYIQIITQMNDSTSFYRERLHALIDATNALEVLESQMQHKPDRLAAVREGQKEETIRPGVCIFAGIGGMVRGCSSILEAVHYGVDFDEQYDVIQRNLNAGYLPAFRTKDLESMISQPSASLVVPADFMASPMGKNLALYGYIGREKYLEALFKTNRFARIAGLPLFSNAIVVASNVAHAIDAQMIYFLSETDPMNLDDTDALKIFLRLGYCLKIFQCYVEPATYDLAVPTTPIYVIYGRKCGIIKEMDATYNGGCISLCTVKVWHDDKTRYDAPMPNLVGKMRSICSMMCWDIPPVVAKAITTTIFALDDLDYFKARISRYSIGTELVHLQLGSSYQRMSNVIPQMVDTVPGSFPLYCFEFGFMPADGQMTPRHQPPLVLYPRYFGYPAAWFGQLCESCSAAQTQVSQQ